MILEELQNVKTIQVTYGRVQNVYADKTMEPEPEIPERNTNTVLDTETPLDLENVDKTEKGKTYVVDDGDKNGNVGEGEGENGSVGEKGDKESDEQSGERTNRESCEDKTGNINGEVDKDEEGIEFDEKQLDDEVEAVTGKPTTKKQEAIYTERASVGTMTPDI